MCTLDLVAEHVAGARDVAGAARPGLRARAGRPRCAATTSAAGVLAPLAGAGRPGRPARRGGLPPAARLRAGLARRTPPGWPGWPGRRVSAAVLTNAVRYADRADAPTVDVLDAARRLVPLDLRHVDRGNAEGFLKSGKQMAEVAEEICRFAGLGDSDGGARPARRAPARSPTGARSTRAPTSAWVRCTSRSSR